MSNIIYLKLTGERQGLISRGCGTEDSIGNKGFYHHEILKDKNLLFKLAFSLF
ncbi:hypothetical protein [Providencia sp. PROV182]|uniref:hypothetical protein n=1 Tax=Providencia sp. PROV182 TaxID=2949885 RepID=UPI0023492B81|nr:hypothetical protein [Providencia sp. PROV182]